MTKKAKPVRVLKPAFDRHEQELVAAKEMHIQAERRNGELEAKLIGERKIGEVLEKQLGEARANVVSLKGELATALETIARMSGYLDRVREDDAIRDGGRTREIVKAIPGAEMVRPGPEANATVLRHVEYGRGGASIDHGLKSASQIAEDAARAKLRWWER